MPFIILCCYMPSVPPKLGFFTWLNKKPSQSEFLFHLASSFFSLLLYQLRHQVPLPPGLGTQKKWKGDKGQGQTVEERKLGMTLQLETYTKFYLLEISLWSSSAEGNTAKHLQYWKPGKCIPWKKAREPKFLLLAKNRSYICCKMCVKKGSRKKA